MNGNTRIAILASVAGILVLGAAAGAFRATILEQWHLHRLGSTQGPVRLQAVRALGELRSSRAVPDLLRLDGELSAAALEALEALEGIAAGGRRDVRERIVAGLLECPRSRGSGPASQRRTAEATR